MTPTDHAIAAMLDTFRRAPIERDWKDEGLRAALGSSPPLEKMKMDKFDRERAEQSLEDEREATQALITELVGALDEWDRLVSDFLDADTAWDNDEMLEADYTASIQSLKTYLFKVRDLQARAKASHGAGT